jgi:glycosyltransferase involved in cell wall biosynthesis
MSFKKTVLPKNFAETSKINSYNFNNLKVSVIIPIYNAEKYLRKSLDSLINQTLKNIEIICINDSSTDDSLNILKKYAFSDNRIKIISKVNEGPGATRKTGLDNASGDYIYFIDSDDWIVENALEKLYENALSNDSDVVFLNFLMYNENEKKFNTYENNIAKHFNNEEIDFNHFTFTVNEIKPFLLNRFFATWTKFYKHSFFEKYDDFYFPKDLLFQDVFFHVQVLLRANKVSYCPDELYIYRISNPNSITNTADKSMKTFHMFDAISNVEKFLIKTNKMNEYNIEFKLFVISHLNLHFERVSDDLSLQFFKKTKEKFIQLNLLESELKEMPEEYNAIYENFVGNMEKYGLFNSNNEVDDNLVEDIKKNKIVIYTAIAGNYDNLKDPDFIDENCDYVCFSDNHDLKSDIWKIILMDKSKLDNNRKVKQYKVLPHKFFPEYKYSFWIDASFRIKNSIRKYIYTNINSPMLNIIYTLRDCIYDEAIISTNHLNYPKAILLKQIEKYENNGMPKNYGLIFTGVIFREHNNPKIIKLMGDWWNEISIFTNQDQISFSYCTWKNNFHPSVSMIPIENNEYWDMDNHDSKITRINTDENRINVYNQCNHNCYHENPLTTYNLINELKNVKNEIVLNKEEINLIINDIDNYEFIYEEYLQKINTISNKENIILEKDSVISEKDAALKIYNSSFSWRITKPVRWFGKVLRKIVNKPFIFISLKSKVHLKKLINDFKSYYIIKNSKLFDENYYINTYPSLKNTQMNLIVHYMYYGYKEGKNPNADFDTNFYLNNHQDIKKLKINPFLHYILYGIEDDRSKFPNKSD